MKTINCAYYLVASLLFLLSINSLTAGSNIHGLYDPESKKKQYFLQYIIDGEIIPVHADFGDARKANEFVATLRKVGVTSNDEIKMFLERGYNASISSLFYRKQNNNKHIYFALATYGIIVSSFIIYKIIQYYKNKQEREASAREELRRQASSVAASNEATFSTQITSLAKS